MVGDECDLVGMKPQIQRVHHSARERHAEVRFEVSAVIPHQCRDAVAAAQPSSLERRRELFPPAIQIPVCIAADAAVWPARSNLAIAKKLARALENVVHRQGEIHHRSAHTPSRTKSLPAESRASYHQSRKGSRLPPLGRAPRSAREAAANQLTALVDSQPELPQDAAELLERLLQPEQPRHPWHLGANDP